MSKILILNGPNLGSLGTREPDVYGRTTLPELEQLCKQEAEAAGVHVEFRQSDLEGELIAWLHEARGSFDAVVMNPAALTHYSIALRDAVAACEVPVVEVHLSNIYARESFRAKSVISPVAAGLVAGLGVDGYLLAVRAALSIIARKGGS